MKIRTIIILIFIVGFIFQISEVFSNEDNFTITQTATETAIVIPTSNKIIEPKVYNALQNEKKVKVIVKLKEEYTEKEDDTKSENSYNTNSIKSHKINLGNEETEENKELSSFLLESIPKSKRFTSFNGFSTELSLEDLEKLQQDPNVEKIYLDEIIYPHLHDTVSIINASNTWTRTINGINLTGKGQTICIIDTGINYTHPDLGNGFGNKVIAGYNSVTQKTNPDNVIDTNGHGTHVAGIAAANGRIKGIAPEANLIAVKACNNTCSGFYKSDIIRGIEWCVNQSSNYNITVISMSLGDSSNQTNYCNNDSIAPAINYAYSKNIAVIISSGNDGNTTGISSPACVQNATPVGASTKQDLIADYSNRNSLVKLFAPGSNINSTYLGNSYGIMSGTSMAAPHVAGAFAIINQYLKLKGKTKTPKEIEMLLYNSGKMIYDNESNRNYSRIDLLSALMLEEPLGINISSPTNGTFYNYSNISLNFTAQGFDIHSCWYSTSTNPNNITTQCNYATFIQFFDATQTITVYANDSIGNIASETVTFFVADAPKYINRIMSPSRFREDNNYTFNVIWYDNTAVNSSTAIITINSTPYYMSNISNNFYFSSSPTLTLVNDVEYIYSISASDIYGNTNTSQNFTFIILNLTNDKEIADKENIVITENITEIIIPQNSIVEKINITNSSLNVSMNLSYLFVGNKARTGNNSFNLIRHQSSQDYSVQIFPFTEISGPDEWDQKIILPVIKDPSEFTITSGNINVVIYVGSSYGLNLSNPALIRIPGMAGKKASWSSGSNVMNEITTECNLASNPTNINQNNPRECYKSDGKDLIIWTYHFTDFAAYTPLTRSSGGGGGGARRANKCYTAWVCSEWSECINSRQKRECIEVNLTCPLKSPKPEEMRACTSADLLKKIQERLSNQTENINSLSEKIYETQAKETDKNNQILNENLQDTEKTETINNNERTKDNRKILLSVLIATLVLFFITSIITTAYTLIKSKKKGKSLNKNNK